MADALNIAQLDHLASQQAQRPTGVSLWRVAAGQHRQFGLHITRELGFLTRTWLVVRSSPQASLEKSWANIPGRAFAAQQCGGNLLVRALLTLTASRTHQPRVGSALDKCSITSEHVLPPLLLHVHAVPCCRFPLPLRLLQP